MGRGDLAILLDVRDASLAWRETRATRRGWARVIGGKAEALRSAAFRPLAVKHVGAPKAAGRGLHAAAGELGLSSMTLDK